jgi:hypothetical protein
MDRYQQKWKLIIPIILLVLSFIDINTYVKADTGTPGIIELDLSEISFNNTIFSGSVPHMGISIAYPLHSRYEVGFTYNTNSSLFIISFSPSFDEGQVLNPSENFESSVKMLYLRGKRSFSKNISGFALVGLSQVQIEIKSFQITCILICGDLITTSNETTYRNKESGIAVGLGIEWESKPDRLWSLKYIDYSNGDLDFTGTHVSRRVQF